jgi:hypothetical protein
MKRRDFLKWSGVGSLTLVGLGGSSLAAAPGGGRSLLLEADRFDDKGGWTLDSQFFDELGFAYLLAHGLGEPVENAKTTTTFPEPGRYWVWVRTKDWVPGDWQSPGRFEVRVDGRSVGTTFGTRSGWGWQKAGPIEVANRQATVELVDLTGFDGRCDAIYFSKDSDDAPPNDRAALTKWRRRQAGMPDTPSERRSFDAVVVGGGLAGCAAALAAHEQGLQVALIQDRPVLGGNASSEIRVHTLGIPGRRKDILSRIDTGHYPNGAPQAKQAEEKRHREMNAAKNVHQFRGNSVYAVHAQGRTIQSVDAFAFETGQARRFEAPVFIDCTGDGWLGYWAGVEYRYGRESKHEFNEGWDRHGELWSPDEADNRVMGSSVLWRSYDADGPAPFPDVPWAMPVAKDHTATSGEWYWEYSANDVHQIKDAEQVRDHMLRAIYGSFANAKKRPQNARKKLEWVSHLVGKRESRRLMGDYIYTMHDALEGRDFDDAVVTEKREVDVHYQRVRRGHPVDFIAKAMYRKPKKRYYHVPFRCLYSKDMDNLMMAGRCFSCSHIGLGGPRVMRTCGQMGVATGFAAALCLKHDTTPRGVYERHLEELRALAGYGQPVKPRLTDSKFSYIKLPRSLKKLHRVTVERGDTNQPAPGFAFHVNAPVTVYIAVHDRGGYTPPAGWSKTAMTPLWSDRQGTVQHTDTVYKRQFAAGRVDIPPHTGQDGSHYGLPHAAFVEARQGKQSELKVQQLPEGRGGRVAAP